MRNSLPLRPDLPQRPDVPAPPSRRPRRRGVAAIVAVAVAVAVAGWFLRPVADPVAEPSRSPSPTAPSTAFTEGPAGPYRFLGRTEDGPLGWNPCRPIRYEVNLSEAPDGALATLRLAVDQAGDATGFTFEYLGTTRRTPVATARDDYLDAAFDPLPVLVSWLPPDRFRAIAPPARAAAIGIPRRGRGPDFPWYTSGQIVVNTGAGSEPGFVTRWDLGPLLLHEWGHVLGLAHVPDRDQIMWSDEVDDADPNPALLLTAYGDGDLAGFARLAEVPCEAS